MKNLIMKFRKGFNDFFYDVDLAKYGSLFIFTFMQLLTFAILLIIHFNK
jgi:hypothetical protein